MYTLEPQKPRWETLIPARGDLPAVEVKFPALPSAKALRKAREAMGEVLRDAGLAPGAAIAGDLLIDAGAAFSRELVRWSILDWRGIGSDLETPVVPTQDIVIIDPDTGEETIEPGTISGFLAEPRLMDEADRVFVAPFTRRDAEKNGYAPSPNGTSDGATPAADTAGSSVTPPAPDDATSAPTASKRSRRTKEKRSGI